MIHWRLRQHRPIPAARVVVFLLALLILESAGPLTLLAASQPEECTIAVISGPATTDGRPLLWKNRDTSFSDNEVVFFNDGTYEYVTLVNAGQTNKAWLGVNDQGFAILNALSYNISDSLSGGMTNGELMKRALQSCATVKDFEALLKETNVPGRENPANLAVLDAVGGATMFEVGNRSWRRFDADDPTVAPEGFLARANFSLWPDTSGVDRYRYDRATRLLREARRGGGIGVETVLSSVSRDLCTAETDPYPLPFEGAPPSDPKAIGYINTANTINRRSTAAGGVVRGVLPGEDPLLSTFYAMLGQPVVTPALPVWVAAGPTPDELDGAYTSPICDLAQSRRADCYDYATNYSFLNSYDLINPSRTAYLGLVERIERWLLPQVEEKLEAWRATGVKPTEVAAFEKRIAREAFLGYKGGPLAPPERVITIRTTPNPMRGQAVIRYELEEVPPAGWSIDVVGIGGRLVRRLAGCGADQQVGCVIWDGRDESGRTVSSGVYFLKPSWPAGESVGSVVVAR